jgi:hypothetical protein
VLGKIISLTCKKENIMEEDVEKAIVDYLNRFNQAVEMGVEKMGENPIYVEITSIEEARVVHDLATKLGYTIFL